MSTSQSEENQTNPLAPGEPELNDLEDTKPRRVAGQPAAAPQAEQTSPPPAESNLAAAAGTPAAPAAGPAEAYTPATQPLGPVEPAAMDAPVDQTRPVVVSGAESAGDSLAQTSASFTSPAAAPAFDETIPPPPGLELPADENATPTGAETRAVPAKRPAGKPGTGKPVRKKAPAASGAGKPGQPGQAGQPGSTAAGRPKTKRRGIPWIAFPLLGLLILLVVAALSAAGGYFSGIGLRKEAASTQSAQAAMDQFQLGLEDMGTGKFYQARQRFEYVIQLDPSFPGATEKLAEALLYLNATATPTLVPTPTVTPTPDTRAVDDLYNQAKQAIQNSDWDAAMDALLALRGKDINAHTVEVDGMLFIALRNRGRTKITKADLEGGIYDLTLAANFAPLDTEAEGLLNWSQMYITGASFWEIDWPQVIQYFSQVAPQMPNLMDSSGMTANERYRQALFEYGNQLAAQGQGCKALELYQQSLAIGQSAEVQAAFENASKGCGGGEATPEQTPKPGKNKKTPTPGP